MEPKPARGIDLIRAAVGTELKRITRYVLSLGNANDELGHGITELAFDGCTLVVKPGPNEDYILIEPGPLDAASLDRRYWTRVDLDRDPRWRRRHAGGRLLGVDCFTDGIDDVALVFRFDSDDRFSFALHETDLCIADGLEVFEGSADEVPRLRERVR